MTPTVFLSVGRTFNAKQENFVVALEEFLKTQGLNPQTVGRTFVANQQPLKSIEELMHQSAGAVILALERTYIESALERRNSEKEKVLQDINLPTVWNQIEAALAYGQGLPLLVLVEHGIKSEGLLETGYDWYVKWISLDELPLQDREFVLLFNSWKKSVEEYQVSMSKEFDKKAVSTIGTPKHLTQLRQILAEKFSEDELRMLVFDLGEDYESLPGTTKTIKAMELVAKMNRYDQLPKLIEVGRQHRTDIAWH